MSFLTIEKSSRNDGYDLQLCIRDGMPDIGRTVGVGVGIKSGALGTRFNFLG